MVALGEKRRRVSLIYRIKKNMVIQTNKGHSVDMQNKSHRIPKIWKTNNMEVRVQLVRTRLPDLKHPSVWWAENRKSRNDALEEFHCTGIISSHVKINDQSHAIVLTSFFQLFHYNLSNLEMKSFIRYFQDDLRLSYVGYIMYISLNSSA